MFDKRKRQFTVKSGCTDEHVGPGSYDVHLISDFKEAVAENTAPFLTSEPRIIECFKAKIFAPTYYPPSDIGKGKTTHFAESCTPRFNVPRPLSPPVGKYNLPCLVGKKILCPDWKKTEKEKKKRHPARLILGKPLTRSHPTPPSFPPKKNYGYYRDVQGILRPVPVPKENCGPEPTTYDIPDGEIYSTRKLYNGCFWSFRTEPRDHVFFTGFTPGPGYYSPYTAIPKHDLYLPARNLSVPRSLDALILNCTKQKLPGPGAYCLEAGDGFCVSRVQRKSPPFASKSKRFPDPKSCTPNPTKYTPKIIGKSPKAALLNTSAPRLSPRGDESLDPARYVIPSFVDELRKKIERSSPNNVFGSHTERGCTYYTINDYPGPMDYDVKFNEKCPTVVISKPPCKPSICEDERYETWPEPGDHDVSRAADYLYAQTSHRKSTKRDRVAFLTGSDRFDKPNRPCAVHTPGPGSYHIALPWLKPKRRVTTCVERFPVAKPELKIDPQFESVVLKSRPEVVKVKPDPRRCRPLPFKRSYFKRRLRVC